MRCDISKRRWHNRVAHPTGERGIAMEFMAGYVRPMERANVRPRKKDHRELFDLISIGPAMVHVFKSLSIHSVAVLARRNPERLFEKLCRLIGERENVCVLDAFSAAVAQARNPRLPVEQCQWWYWSRKRLAREKRRRRK
jgi:hypothetical protein